jgi:hypothetical protein
MPRSLARLSASASSHRGLSSVVFITNIAESGSCAADRAHAGNGLAGDEPRTALTGAGAMPSARRYKATSSRPRMLVVASCENDG